MVKQECVDVGKVDGMVKADETMDYTAMRGRSEARESDGCD